MRALNHYIFSLIFIFIGDVRAINKTVSHCCPSEHTILSQNNTCWQAKTNTTTPLSLQCKKYGRFRDFNITEDLKLSFKLVGDETFVFGGRYCLGNLTNKSDEARKKLRLFAFLCVDEQNEIIDDKVLGYCLIVSVLFLVPTALIYSALPELRDVQGKSIINFCISLTIGQIILIIMKLGAYSDMALCATRGFLAYFFVIAAFFWTNSISIQILLNTRRPTILDYSWHGFKWYFIYAWGIPTVLTVCMAIVNFHPGHHPKPGIGLNHCWFGDNAQRWYYMYSVMSLLLATNIVIFVYVSLVLWRLSFSSSHLKALKYKFIMTVRLIILMGLPWVFEMIGSLAGAHVVWAVIDIFNCLQGILIFLLLVVFRRRVIKLMYKHSWLNCISGFVEKHLAVEDDEENVMEHTDVSLTDNTRRL